MSYRDKNVSLLQVQFDRAQDMVMQLEEENNELRALLARYEAQIDGAVMQAWDAAWAEELH
jgi:hypothetical protein